MKPVHRKGREGREGKARTGRILALELFIVGDSSQPALATKVNER
jgi:hypothetical protein